MIVSMTFQMFTQNIQQLCSPALSLILRQNIYMKVYRLTFYLFKMMQKQFEEKNLGRTGLQKPFGIYGGVKFHKFFIIRRTDYIPDCVIVIICQNKNIFSFIFCEVIIKHNYNAVKFLIVAFVAVPGRFFANVLQLTFVRSFVFSYFHMKSLFFPFLYVIMISHLMLSLYNNIAKLYKDITKYGQYKYSNL